MNKKMENSVGALLEKRPYTYGYRGDIHLWEELIEELKPIPLPDNETQLVTIIKDAIHKLTGHKIDDNEVFFVERYNTGGMSSGCILPKFWLEEGIPLIVDHFQTVKKSFKYKVFRIFRVT
jgi:hypothetical protein